MQRKPNGKMAKVERDRSQNNQNKKTACFEKVLPAVAVIASITEVRRRPKPDPFFAGLVVLAGS
jgi:hypothetical protein